jgi:small conductance mechanosensitive channel
MMKKLNEMKFWLFLKKYWVWFASSIFVLLVIFAGNIFGKDSRLAHILGTSEGGFKAIGNFFDDHLDAIISSIMWLVLILIISYVLRRLVIRFISFGKKGKTAGHLIDSLLKYVASFAIIIIVLIEWGVNVTSLLAGLGILGLLLGLGAQSLIADIVSGLFIVFEGDYQVGDVVVLDDYRGTVEAIGLRTTKVKDVAGNIKIINNSEIKSLINMTVDLSVALVDVDIAYTESIEHIESLFRDHMKAIKDNVPDLIDGPFYKGISAFNPSGMTLRFIGKVEEDKRYQVERDLRRAIKILFDQNNIEIPFQTITISNYQEVDSKAISKATKRKAEVFVEEQKELSKDIQEQE